MFALSLLFFGHFWMIVGTINAAYYAVALFFYRNVPRGEKFVAFVYFASVTIIQSITIVGFYHILVLRSDPIVTSDRFFGPVIPAWNLLFFLMVRSYGRQVQGRELNLALDKLAEARLLIEQLEQAIEEQVADD